MARADDDEALRRRGRARPRAPPPTSIASMYAPVDATNRQEPAPRSSKMKMASLMVDESDVDESKNKRVKVNDQDADDWAPRNAPLSISSLVEEPPASSLFQNEMPTIIQSFSDERRASQAAVNGESKNGVTNGEASTATRSMYDFYFPSGRVDANGASNGRSLKRKRRSGRRGDDLAVAEVDLLRFGVDAAKLVPQGLVDRVDVHMSRTVLGKVVGNHVTNWCNRSGFAPTFLQEITTLLAAYYPCNYPTLLDEVLAGFLLRRPEFIHLLLPAMLEKMSKTGESVSTIKYPVADALVRMCAMRTGPQMVARQDLVCTSLLRCLVEHNGDRFVLSPWIAACAIESSDSVLHTLWRALLPRTPGTNDKVWTDDDDLQWRIEDPAQQIVELLAEEGKLCVCRISCGFVKLILSDDDLMKQLVESQSYLVPDCLERMFKYASTSWSASLMAEWLERRRKQQPEGTDVAGSFKDLTDFLVRFNLKLSVKKPKWFISHVISFVLSPQCHAAEQESALRAILRDHMPFVFGEVNAHLLDQKSRQNGSSESSAVTASVTTESLDVVGSHSVLEVRSNIELLVGLLIAANPRTSALFLDIWSEAWSDKRMTLSWGYVHALVCVTIQNTIEDRSELGQKLQSFATRVCRSYYDRLSRRFSKDNAHDEVAAKYSEILNLLLPSTRPIAGVLLEEVLGTLADFEQKHSAVACSIFGNVVTLHLGSCSDGGMDTSVKRSVVQKSLVEYERSPANLPTPSTKTAHFLTTLSKLISTKNDTGDFTRHVLSSGPVVRLLAGLLNFGRRRRRQEMLLDVMNAVVTSTTSGKLTRDWARQYVVQELVHCAYTGPPTSARRAISLLQNIFRHSTNGIRSLLWVVLQHCTKLCCGREEKRNGGSPALLSDNYQDKADVFAELVKAMMVTVPTSTVREVLSFVEQKLASCSVGKSRVNMFLLLLLRKLVVCEFQCGVLLPVVQLAVCPLAPPDLDQIRLIQLQLLKALCTRLVAVRHRRVASSKLSDVDLDWKCCKDLMCNEKLQSDLRSLVKVAPLNYGGVYERTSRACEVLAQGILAVIHQLKQQKPIDEEGAQRIPKRSRMK